MHDNLSRTIHMSKFKSGKVKESSTSLTIGARSGRNQTLLHHKGVASIPTRGPIVDDEFLLTVPGLNFNI